nr:hypothetical protein [Haladaptatus halobius]
MALQFGKMTVAELYSELVSIPGCTCVELRAKMPDEFVNGSNRLWLLMKVIENVAAVLVAQQVENGIVT